MILGHSAGTAAAIYAGNSTAGKVIQDVDMAVLTAALEREGQVSRQVLLATHTRLYQTAFSS